MNRTPTILGLTATKKRQTAHRPAEPKTKAAAEFSSVNLITALSLITLLFLLAVSFALRIWGNQFGLPFLFHPDEQSIVERAITIMRTGDFSPHWFHYPSLYIYIQTLSDIIVFLGLSAKQIENIALPLTATPEYVQVGRAVTALMGTLTVLVVYLAGKALFSMRVGLLAAALLTFSLLHTIHSHYVTTDVPTTLFTTLTFLMSVMVLRKGETRYYLLAGLAAGLSASTKYNGAIAIVSLLVAHCFVAWRTRTILSLSALTALPGFALGFLVGTPYALLELPRFLSDFAFEIAHYRSGQPGFEGSDNIQWYAQAVLGSWDGLALIFAIGGAALSLAKRRAAYLLLIVFPVLYFWWFTNFIVRFERNLVPLTPFIALLAAVFIDWLASVSFGRRPRLFAARALCTVVLLAIAIVPSIVGIVQFDGLLSAKHPKTLAGEWGNSNLPRGARIAVEHYGIPLDPRSFELVNVLSISNYNADWFVEQGFDYVVLSDGIWSRLYMEPQKYSKEIAAYQSVFDRFEMLKAVELSAPSSRLVSYPTVDVYHLPYVRVFKVSKEAG